MKLRIKETAWCIDRTSGGYSERLTADVCFPCETGNICDVGKGKRHFTIDDVTENSVGFSVHCADPKYNKTWIIKKGEEITYRPRSFDGGYFYDIKLIQDCTAMNAIGIKIKKADGKHDFGASKFFGAPVIPAKWLESFSDDVIFFAQIRLSDIAELDTENKLPHTGYLYLFLDTEMYPYQAMAYYYDGKPDVVIDDFNETEPQFARLNEDWLMSFEPVGENFDGIRLLGIPSSDYETDDELLLQFDPLAENTGFLDDIDGYAYFFFGEDKYRIDGVRFYIDRS